MQVGGWGYLGIFLATVATSLFFTPLALRLATRRDVLDHPGGHKGHESPVPYLGGIAIVGSFALAILAATFLRPPASGATEVVVILLAALGLSVIGLVDDLRGLGPWIRLVLEVAAALAMVGVGATVQLTGVVAIDAALTIIWIAGITNAFNLLDNMDGLSAGVAAIAAGWFFVLAASNGQFLVASLSVALAGCAIGFLRSNFHPARIYMGDAGSLFLGFLLAVLGIKLQFDAPRQVTFLVPVAVLGVAIFDTILVTTTRLLHRLSPLSGGRDHTSHRLVMVGIPVPYAVALIYGAALALGWLALVMSRVDLGSGLLLGGFVLTTALFGGVLLGQVPVYATSRQRHLMLQEVRRHEQEPPAARGRSDVA